jgi:hypothetical protein
MQQQLHTNFFESVSKHDLERFHSECLCWLLYNNQKLTSEWIKEIISKESPVNNFEIELDSINVFTEVDQLDIVILYKKKSCDKYFGIIIENKVKANEHLIKVKKPENFLNFENGDELSQTEYYYFRNIATKEIFENEKTNNKILVQILGDEGKINKSKNTTSKVVKREDCHYIFLVPNKILDVNSEYSNIVGSDYNFGKINYWSRGNNPWITYTYIELADFLNKNKSLVRNSVPNNQIYSNGYIDFLYSQFNKPVDLNNYSNNKYGKLEYMKFLRAAIYEKLNTECKELNKNGKVEAKSSNSGDPLFSIVVNKELRLGYNDNFELGFQLQGINNKIYVSAGDKYDFYKFNPKSSDEKQKDDIKQNNELQKYRNTVNSILKEIIDSEKFKSILKSLDVTPMEPHPNTTKSFYSYSFKFEAEVKKENFSIANKIEILSDLINTTFQVYNNISFTSSTDL